jgi:hypothetical protein
MTQREKLLATTLLVLLLVLGGGVVLHLFVWTPLSDLSAQINSTRETVLKRQAELASETQQLNELIRLDPRLKLWQKISLPPRNPEDKKPGVSPEEQKRKHLAQMQVEYERYLSELLRSSGFRSDSIVITSRQPDRRSTPAVKGKEPLFERLAFGVTGRANFASTITALRRFHETPLLHQIRTLTIALAAERTGRSTNAAGTLDVNMVVEALVVNGAEERASLLPSNLPEPLRVLADRQDSSNAPYRLARDYTVLDKRSMYTGYIPPRPPQTREPEEPRVVTEDRNEVLRFVKVTMICYDEQTRRWEATLYDQAKGGPEKRVNTRTRDELVIYDKDENPILEARIVRIDEQGIIIQEKDRFYRVRCGDFLYPAMREPLNSKDLSALGLVVSKEQ